MNKHSQILKSLSTAPDSQLDKSICERLKTLSERDSLKAEDIKKILDDCAYGSLASDLVMRILDIVWRELKE